MTHLRRDLQGDSGNITLAMLLTIVVTGIALVLTMDAVRGQLATAGDRNFTLAIHNADAGVQAAVYTLNRRSREATYGGALGDPHPGSTTTGPYTWRAVLGADGRTWRVSSTGSYRGQPRTVVADLRNTNRFEHALLTDRSTRLVGNNVFDTYRSPSYAPALSPNEAVLGSNGTVKAVAGSTTAAGTRLYNYLEDGNPQRCVGTTALCGAPQQEPAPASLTSDDDLRFITTALAACRTAAGVTQLPDWIASRDAVMSGGVAYFAPGTPGPYCYRNMIFDRTTRFSPAPGKPAVVYLDGTLTVTARTTVNIGPTETAPDSTRLQVYTATTGTIDWETNSRFAGGLYAPRAACGDRSGASVEIYGALVCGTFDSRGGLRFHYDLSLRDSTTGSYGIVGWQEQVG